MKIKIFLISIIIVQMFMLFGCTKVKPNDNEIKPACNKDICRIAINSRTKPTPIKISKRVALVIGNADYKFAPLKNPVNDARDMAKVLKDLGFDVIYEKNASQKLMIDAINKFQKKLGKDVLGLFYFSGHGVQHEGINYMIPIGMSELTVSNVKFNSVKIDYVLSTMTETNNQVNIIILDACRDTPFRKGDKTMAKGLAIVNYAPSGSLIAYATAPNQVAKDGYGDNSPYTKHLKTIIRKPGLSIEKMFKEVRNAVLTETNEEQTPWEHSSLKGDDIYLAGKEQQPLLEPEPEPKPELEPKPETKSCKNCNCKEILRKESLTLEVDADVPPSYNTALEIEALISKAEKAYDNKDYQTALDLFTQATQQQSLDKKSIIKAYIGLYRSNINLKDLNAAEKAFGKIVSLNIDKNKILNVKFLFEVSKTTFTETLAAEYPLWLRQIGQYFQQNNLCLEIVGHSSHTGKLPYNCKLSLNRAVAIQQKLETNFSKIKTNSKTDGKAWAENIVGSGTDDAQDAIDRRVGFKVTSCPINDNRSTENKIKDCIKYGSSSK